MSFNSCKNCAYRTLNPQTCPVIGFPYETDKSKVCPYWTNELPQCDVCGQLDPNYFIRETSEGTYIRICKTCQSKSGTCGGCLKSTVCDFETNPSPIPKAVEKRIQQGNQIMITQVMNPLRIDETCRKNCECFSEENGCLRKYNNCDKYERVF